MFCLHLLVTNGLIILCKLSKFIFQIIEPANTTLAIAGRGLNVERILANSELSAFLKKAITIFAQAISKKSSSS